MPPLQRRTRSRDSTETARGHSTVATSSVEIARVIASNGGQSRPLRPSTRICGKSASSNRGERVETHGLPDRERRIDRDRIETGRVSMRVPAIDFAESLIKRDGRVRRVGRRWPSDPERRDHAVAQELDDRNGVILDDRN